MNTTYFLNLMAGNIYGAKKDPGIPAAYYVGLSSTAPSADGTNVTEPVGGGYKRVMVQHLGEPENGVVQNTQAIEFPESTSAWGKFTHYAIYDAESGGNLLMYGEFAEPRTIETGTVLIMRTGAVSLSIKNDSAVM